MLEDDPWALLRSLSKLFLSAHWLCPRLVLVMRFFFPDANTWLQHLPAFSGDQVRATIVAVLVAACAYCLGAAVARLGQDFFDPSA
jgi:hypothetical protein